MLTYLLLNSFADDLGDMDDETDIEDSATLDLLSKVPPTQLSTILSPREISNGTAPTSPRNGGGGDGDAEAPGSAEKSGSAQGSNYSTPTSRTPRSRSIGGSTPAGLNFPPSLGSTMSSMPPSRGLETPDMGSGLMSPPGEDWESFASHQFRSPEDMLFGAGSGVSGHPSGLNSAGKGNQSRGSFSSSQAPSGTQTPSEMIVGMSGGSNTYSSGQHGSSGEFLDDIEPISVVAPVLTPFGDIGGDYGSGDSSLASSVTASVARAAALLQAEREFPNWDPVAQSVLRYYQNQGDVQTCVYMALVLHDMMQLPKKQVMSWFMAYVDILHRLQLYHYATEIIKHAHLDAIKGTSLTVSTRPQFLIFFICSTEMNKKSTSYSTSCPTCNKPLLKKSGVTCDRCKKATAKCSICQLPVRGSYVWCQGCGHGGHADHLREWFQSNQACPTGCGHVCNFQRNPSASSEASKRLPSSNETSRAALTGSNG
jgi:hypothetical protein